MTYLYQEAQLGSYFQLLANEPELQRQFFKEQDLALLTIAWNQGPAQTVWVDDVPYQLGTGQVILLIIKHSYRFEQPKSIVAWRFNRDFYCIIDHDEEVSCVGLIFYGMPSPMVLDLNEVHQRKIDLLYQVFIDELGTHDNLQGEMLRMLLKRLILILTRLAKDQHLKTPVAGDELDIIRQFNLLVEKHFNQHHQVQDYAELLYKSPKTLSNLFGKYSEKTPLQVIRERIALEAKRLLRYTDKSISEIAYDVGFQEGAHFSRFFKKMEGMNPKSFREEIRLLPNPSVQRS